MQAFTLVMAKRPVSSNGKPNPRFTEALRKHAQLEQPSMFDGRLYARVYWFHKDPTSQDVDNIPKRILDSLKDLVFMDDGNVSYCLAARVDATIDYELSPLIVKQ